MSKKIIILLSLALALRLAFVFSAYHGDLNNNISWGKALVERGAVNYYEDKVWSYSAPNQPPLYILLFGACVWLYERIGDLAWYLNDHIGFFPSPFIWFWELKGIILLVKIPSILADLGIGYLIYRYFQKKEKQKLGFWIALLWLFNPISWYNSAIWGQTDALVNLIGLGAILSLFSGGLALSLVLITVSLLFKGSLALLILVLLFYALGKRLGLGKWLWGAILSGLTVIVTTIWFHPSFDLPIWLWNLYNQRIFPGEIGYLTANAFNFWWLVDSGKTLDYKIFLGLSARVWGLIITILGIGGSLFWMVRKRFTQNSLLCSLAIISLISFLFMTRIHERYMYPFFPVGTMLVGIIPGFGILYGLLSVTHLLNLYHLFWYPSFAPLETLYLDVRFPVILSVANLIVFFLILVLLVLRQLRSSKL